MMSQRNSICTLYSFLRHPYVAREEIVAFQNMQLRQLIDHAYTNVTYYRRLFERHGLKPQDIRGVDDLSLIPITSKTDLKSLSLSEVVARNIDPTRLIVRSSSGSSGEPFSVRRTWFEERVLGLLRQRAMHNLGRKIADKEVIVGLLRCVHPRDSQRSSQILAAMGLFRRERIDCLSPPEKIIQRLRHLRPHVVTGFPGVLSRVAEGISDQDRRAIRPRLVAVGGEVLTQSMRRQISQAFEAPVFDLYGSWEFNLLAWECRETGEYHTCDDGLILEVLKDGRSAVAGERGEAVGTNLHSFAMPLIRYKLGDVVTKGSESCRCGRPFSSIRGIQGRMIDYFLLSGSRILHPYDIVTAQQLHAARWIRQYQLVQERKDRVVLRIAPWNAAVSAQQEIARITESAQKVLGSEIEFQVILVPEIRPEPSGKFQVLRSLVTSADDRVDRNHLQAAITHPQLGSDSGYV
jgi:phenylacetate-CoA ligase